LSTRARQVEAIARFLERPSLEEVTTEEVAKRIVDDFYGLLLPPVGESPPAIRPGIPFKCTLTEKITHVGWTDGDLYWIITADSRYGYLGPIDPWVPYAAETRAKSGGPGNNSDGWQVGDAFTDSFARGRVSEVIATANKCVLLKTDGSSRPFAEPNDSINKYYRKKKVHRSDLFKED
jgi:hypothetical protein